ncbi:MAG: hypothetical protein KGL42_08595 [Betaproteobacteria bacterium]|nr:hypothetical protein [Betaproteobacteria bacterium]
MPCHPHCNQGRHCDGTCQRGAPRPLPEIFGPALAVAGWLVLVLWLAAQVLA